MTTTTTQDQSVRGWPREPATGRGRSHGTSSSEPFDRWFRYPAGFASDYVERLLDHLDLQRGTVVDCFAGSGVTGTAARSRGLDFFGIEAHPMVAELAALKVAPTSSGPNVRKAASAVAASAARRPRLANHDDEPELVRRSFTDNVLSDLIALRSDVSELDDAAASYLKWALLASLRDVASVKVGWPYQRPGVARRPRATDVQATFLRRARLMADDLDSLQGTSSARMVMGDARDPQAWKAAHAQEGQQAMQACVGSPPYLNNFDYADATRLEAYFWGTASNWRELCTVVRSDMLTATTQQSSRSQREEALAALPLAAPPIATAVSGLVEQIASVRRDRGGRTKEYDQVVPAYFLAMSQVLLNVHGALDAGGSLLWLVGDSAPYGVHVDTPALIAELSTGLGFRVQDDVVLRRRGGRWGTAPHRHDVALTERLIVLRRE